MSLRDTEIKYGSISKFFHWTIALLVLLQAYLALWTIYMLPEGSPTAALYIGILHKPIGVITLDFTILAVFWRMANPKPAFTPNMNRMEKDAAKTVHHSLYLLIILMGGSGVLMTSFAGRTIEFWGYYTLYPLFPKNDLLSETFYTVHVTCAYLIYAFLAIHIMAVIKHQFINRDSILRRMLPFS